MFLFLYFSPIKDLNAGTGEFFIHCFFFWVYFGFSCSCLEGMFVLSPLTSSSRLSNIKIFAGLLQKHLPSITAFPNSWLFSAFRISFFFLEPRPRNSQKYMRCSPLHYSASSCSSRKCLPYFTISIAYNFCQISKDV